MTRLSEGHMKSIGLESKNLIDVWEEVGKVDVSVDDFLKFQDDATELQIETLKFKALQTLQDALLLAEQDSDRITAAKALLQHFRDEKRRCQGRRALINETELLHESSVLGPWNLKKPGTM